VTRRKAPGLCASLFDSAGLCLSRLPGTAVETEVVRILLLLKVRLAIFA